MQVFTVCITSSLNACTLHYTYTSCGSWYVLKISLANSWYVFIRIMRMMVRISTHIVGTSLCVSVRIVWMMVRINTHLVTKDRPWQSRWASLSVLICMHLVITHLGKIMVHIRTHLMMVRISTQTHLVDLGTYCKHPWQIHGAYPYASCGRWSVLVCKSWELHGVCPYALCGW